MSTPTTITIPADVQKAAESVHPILAQAQAIQITCPQEASDASLFLASIKGAAKDLEDKRFSMTRPLDAAKASIMDFFRKPGEVLAQAEKAVKAKMDGYLREVKRQADLIAEANRKEALRLEQERQAAEAEQKRLADEAAEDARKAAAAGQEGDLAAALALHRQSQSKMATAGVPIPVVMPVALPAPPKPAGVSLRLDWVLDEVVDPNLVPREFLVVDEAALNRYAKIHGADTKVPGCRFKERSIVAGRRG